MPGFTNKIDFGTVKFAFTALLLQPNGIQLNRHKNPAIVKKKQLVAISIKYSVIAIYC